jgi:hypothetical protein
MTVNYLGKVWEVDNFLDFANKVKNHYKADFVTGWALGLTAKEYTAKKAVLDAIELKALADFWRTLV